VAGEQEKLSTDQRVRRSVARTLGNLTLGTVVLGALGLWLSLGVYTLDPGEAAILLRLGKHAGTVRDPGVHWTLPPPITLRQIENVGVVRNEDFGVAAPGESADASELVHESSMQTSDNNIVRVSFTVQYRIGEPYAARYLVADLPAIVRSASAAAMREVVGRMTVDGVLREQRAMLTSEARTTLQAVFDRYYKDMIEVQAVELQDVQAPSAVRAAFDDVVAAIQDASRHMNEAEGYRNQVIPNARAESVELIEAANGYRDARIAEATGEAARFTAVNAEYRKAPAVTRKRLYLETMEAVLPGVEKVIVKPGQVMPYLPLGRPEAKQRPETKP
jgi:modulator of FtsH protease HflK